MKDDTISRQAAIDEIRKCRFVVDAIKKIRGLPSAEHKKGEWTDLGGVIRWGCPHCHYAQEVRYNFCPNCGADMRGEQG